MATQRKRLDGITWLRTARKVFGLYEGQAFYETAKSYELWEESPLALVCRWPKTRVLWCGSDRAEIQPRFRN